MPDPRETPAMQQYYRFKQRHPECVLLFRIGDFYEMFDDDAVRVSKAIGLTLTQRTEGVPMAGVPFHQLEGYLRKLLRAGFRIAVAEQVEDAAQSKGIVRREVTRVLTPGTLVDETLLDGEAPNALAAIAFTDSGEHSPAALAIVEASTGKFLVFDAGPNAIIDELMRRGVREVLYPATADAKVPPRVEHLLAALRISGTPRPSWHFRHDDARQTLLSHFSVQTLAGFGLADTDSCISPAGAVLRYLQETQTPGGETPANSALTPSLAHLQPPRRETAEDACVIDAVSLRSLEIERTVRTAGGAASGSSALDGSLLGIFLSGKGVCRTAMGKRTLREWLCRPLRRLPAISARHDAIALLTSDRTLASTLGGFLDHVQDIPRIAGRIALARATPRDIVALAKSLAQAGPIADAIDHAPAMAHLHARIAPTRDTLSPLADTIQRQCVESPPPHLREGGLFKDGIDPALDEARMLQRDAGAWLAAYQARLIEQHKLPSLKVGFNKIFGYYIELPSAQARTAPAELTRKQTLKNAERFITPELREFEGKVMNAEARAYERERELFAHLCGEATAVLADITTYADALAELDALLGLADKAQRRGWVRPAMVEQPVLQIHGGRHPVLDELLSTNFVPNDVELGDPAFFSYPTDAGGSSPDAIEEETGTPGDADPSSPNHPHRIDGAASRVAITNSRSGGRGSRSPHQAPSLALITGPNMAGKSTFIRQVALIALLAHAGSFVPADRATVGLIDRIFTRIGADDALHAGQSTFMVEMIETANILHHATPQSLVVLDEVGRGTSTLDGLSLAWAIAEHLAATGARALFATHYHEITELEERLAGRVKNLHVAVREWPPGDPHAQLVFLHRILPGRTDQSYGVQVARLAGIPAPVVARAREVLESLAVHHGAGTSAPLPAEAPTPTKRSRARVSDNASNHASQGLLFSAPTPPHPAMLALRELKLESLSPLQAFDRLRELSELAQRDPAP
jgi:DNA mismatch repair protein MutS